MNIDIWFVISNFLGILTGLFVFDILKNWYEKRKRGKKNV